MKKGRFHSVSVCSAPRHGRGCSFGVFLFSALVSFLIPTEPRRNNSSSGLLAAGTLGFFLLQPKNGADLVSFDSTLGARRSFEAPKAPDSPPVMTLGTAGRRWSCFVVTVVTERIYSRNSGSGWWVVGGGWWVVGGGWWVVVVVVGALFLFLLVAGGCHSGRGRFRGASNKFHGTGSGRVSFASDMAVSPGTSSTKPWKL